MVMDKKEVREKRWSKNGRIRGETNDKRKSGVTT